MKLEIFLVDWIVKNQNVGRNLNLDRIVDFRTTFKNFDRISIFWWKYFWTEFPYLTEISILIKIFGRYFHFLSKFPFLDRKISKIWLLPKIDILVQNLISWQKSKFRSKITFSWKNWTFGRKSNFMTNIEILAENQVSLQKLKFWSKIELDGNNRTLLKIVPTATWELTRALQMSQIGTCCRYCFLYS